MKKELIKEIKIFKSNSIYVDMNKNIETLEEEKEFFDKLNKKLHKKNAIN
jgi:hypothetical protein